MEKIVVATSNQNKLKEIKLMLQDYEIVSAREAGFTQDVEETGTTFEENALLKARTVSKATGMIALADDSGLCVDALDGAPGVYSARYSGGDDKQNRALLLRYLQGEHNREAHFCCVIAVVFPNGKELTASGMTYGSILHEERGTNGFGYDSLFLSDDLKKSFAEATDGEKNAVSHRGRALAAMKALLGETK